MTLDCVETQSTATSDAQFVAPPADAKQCSASTPELLLQVPGELLSDDPYQQVTHRLKEKQHKAAQHKAFYTQSSAQVRPEYMTALQSALRDVDHDPKIHTKGRNYRLLQLLKRDKEGVLHRELEQALQFTHQRLHIHRAHTLYLALTAMSTAGHAASQASLIRLLQSDAICKGPSPRTHRRPHLRLQRPGLEIVFY